MNTTKLLLKSMMMAIVITVTPIAVAQQRPLSEAMNIATSHLQKRVSTQGKRLAPPTEAASIVRSSELYVGQIKEKDTEAFYVFTYPVSKCYVIVSGDERMSRILAYSDESRFDAQKMSPQTKSFIQSYVNELNALQENGQRKAYYKKRQAPTAVDAMLNSLWSQGTPFNNHCPTISGQRTLTGCMATLMAQLMYHYKYPAVGKGSIDYTTATHKIPVSIQLETMPFDWDNMKIWYDYPYDNITSDAVAQLMFACGASVQMDYGLESSSSSMVSAHSALINNFGYERDIMTFDNNKMTDEDFHEIVQKELADGRPVPFSGSNPLKGGHAYLVDGMRPDGEDTPFYHFNWGWGETNNGYYKIAETEFSEGISVMVNCQPDNDVTEYPNCLQAKAIKPSLDKINLSKSHELGLNITEMTSTKFGKFTGTIQVYLIDSIGNEWLVGNSPWEIERPYFSSTGINISLPKNLALGTYTFELRARDNLLPKEEHRVYVRESEPIIVTNENVSYTPDIQITEMVLDKTTTNGHQIGVNMSNLLNMGAATFQGDLTLALTNQKGEVIYRSETHLNIKAALAHFSYYSTINLVCDFPAMLNDGKYRLVAQARQQSYNEWGNIRKFELSDNYIISSNQNIYLNVIIENNDIKFDETEIENTFTTDIETTEMTLNESDCIGNTISITIADVFNLNARKFVGELSLALTDDENEVNVVFGTATSIPSLYQLQLQPWAITLTGEVPDTIADGHYRLRVAARQQGYENWTPISKITIEEVHNEDGTISKVIKNTQEEIYYDLWATDGKVRLRSYEPEDVNQDGSVDTQDVLAIYNYMTRSTSPDENPAEDVNRDGTVDTQDALKIYEYISIH